MIDIVPVNLCTGCGVCASVCPKKCIHMSFDNEGFIAPVVNRSDCINCGLCEKHCHVLEQKASECPNPITLGAFTRDNIVRDLSSSGGFFFFVAKEVINRGGLVYGAVLNDELIVKHARAESIDELSRMLGSKYVQSEVDGDIYKSILSDLNNNKLVLFSGTPCQCAAVKQLAKKDYDNLLLLTFICHGVPSPKVWKRYIQFKESKNRDKIVRAHFRDKTFGWARFSMRLEYASGKIEVNPLEKDLFLKAFLKNNCLRNSCYACKYKGKSAYSGMDIIMSDWWGAEDIPLYHNSNNKGISSIYINSNKGAMLWSTIKDSFEYSVIDYKKASSGNIAYSSPAVRGIHRDEFMKQLDSMPFDKLVNKYCKTPLWIMVKRKTIPVVYAIAKKSGLLKIYKSFKR